VYVQSVRRAVKPVKRLTAVDNWHEQQQVSSAAFTGQPRLEPVKTVNRFNRVNRDPFRGG
jgi:hypothetical protein